MLKKILFVFIISLIVISCSSNKSLANLPSEVKWQRAENFYNKKRYNKAIPYYEQIIFERSSIYTAEAQFKLGECHYNMKKYIEAIFEYQELLRLFPEHSHASNAQYKIGVSYAMLANSAHLDQSETERAIDAFTIFGERYPLDERQPQAIKIIADMQTILIKKTYLNGYIYFRMKDYPASQLYLNEIMRLGNRNEIEKKSAYYNALIHIDRREKEPAEQFVKHLAEYFPNSKEHKSATKRLSRMNSKLWHLIYMY